MLRQSPGTHRPLISELEHAVKLLTNYSPRPSEAIVIVVDVENRHGFGRHERPPRAAGRRVSWFGDRVVRECHRALLSRNDCLQVQTFPVLLERAHPAELAHVSADRERPRIVLAVLSPAQSFNSQHLSELHQQVLSPGSPKLYGARYQVWRECRIGFADQSLFLKPCGKGHRPNEGIDEFRAAPSATDGRDGQFDRVDLWERG